MNIHNVIRRVHASGTVKTDRLTQNERKSAGGRKEKRTVSFTGRDENEVWNFDQYIEERFDVKPEVSGTALNFHTVFGLLRKGSGEKKTDVEDARPEHVGAEGKNVFPSFTETDA